MKKQEETSLAGLIQPMNKIELIGGILKREWVLQNFSTVNPNLA